MDIIPIKFRFNRMRSTGKEVVDAHIRDLSPDPILKINTIPMIF